MSKLLNDYIQIRLDLSGLEKLIVSREGELHLTLEVPARKGPVLDEGCFLMLCDTIGDIKTGSVVDQVARLVEREVILDMIKLT
jgi:hypothetical protein